MSATEPAAGDDFAELPPVSRRLATIANLVYQYAMIGTALVRGVVLTPFVLHYVGDGLYGAWVASLNIMNWLWVSEGGAWLLVRQQVATEFGARNRASLADCIGTGWVLMLLPAVFFGGAGVLLAPVVPGFLEVSDPGDAKELTRAIVIFAIATGLMVIASGPRAVQQGLQRQITVNVLHVAAEVAGLICTIILLFSGWALLSIPAGVLAREIIYNLAVWPLAAVTLRRLRVRPRVSGARFGRMFGLMGWTFMTNLSETLRQNIDGVVVSKCMGNEAVTITDLSKKIWDVGTMVVQRISAAFTPAMAHLFGTGETRLFREIAGKLFAVITIAIALMLGGGWALNEDFMNLWVPLAGATRFAGHDYNVLFGLAAGTNLMIFMVCEVLFAAGSIRTPAVVRLIQTVVRIGLLLLFMGVLNMGYIAIPLSMLAAIAVSLPHLLVRHWRRVLELTSTDAATQAGMLARSVGLVAVLAAASRLIPGIPHANSWVLLAVHGVVFVALAVGALYLTDRFVRTELDRVAARVLRRRS